MNGVLAVPRVARNAATPFNQETRWGPVGWRAIAIPSDPQQIGLYGEAILSQFPARWDGIQRENGVSAMYPGWTVPGPNDDPIWLRTQRPTNLPGTQRFGSTAPYGQGPIAVRSMNRAVTQAQINQSGLASQAWAAQIAQWS